MGGEAPPGLWTCVPFLPGVHSSCSGVRGFARAVCQPAGAQSDRKAVKQSGDRRNRLRSKNSIVCRDGVVRHGDAWCVRVLGCIPGRRSSDQVRRSRKCSLMPFHSGVPEIGVQGHRALPRPGFSGTKYEDHKLSQRLRTSPVEIFRKLHRAQPHGLALGAAAYLRGERRATKQGENTASCQSRM